MKLLRRFLSLIVILLSCFQAEQSEGKVVNFHKSFDFFLIPTLNNYL